MEEKKKNDMKKIIIAIIAIVAIVGIVLFANQQAKNAEAKRKLEEAVSNIRNITVNDFNKDSSSNATISEQDTNNSSTSTISNTVMDNSDKSENAETQYAEVKIGQTITINDYLEYSFIDNKFTKKVEPSNPKSYYHYYEAKSDDNILVAVKTKIKNLQAEEFDGEQIPKATVLYDGKYKYNCSLVVEEDDGSDLDGYHWYMDIEPLKTKTFYYYAELPKSVKDDGKSLKLRIDLKGNSYELIIR